MRKEPGKYLWKNLPAQGRVNAGVRASQVGPKTAEKPCACSKGKKERLLGTGKEVRGDKLYRAVQDLSRILAFT